MLCCVFHVIRVLSVCFTLFNFVNTIMYWFCILFYSEFQNKHVHFRNQYTLSEWVHSKQSLHPSRFSNSFSIHNRSTTTFTIVIILFFSREEEETSSPAQFSIPNKRKWKAKRSDWNLSLGQAKLSPDQSLYNHIEAFLVIRDFPQVFCVFRLRKTSKSRFHSTKFGSLIYHTMRNSLDLKNWLW